jgi:hypothetical protein
MKDEKEKEAFENGGGKEKREERLKKVKENKIPSIIMSSLKLMA